MQESTEPLVALLPQFTSLTDKPPVRASPDPQGCAARPHRSLRAHEANEWSHHRGSQPQAPPDNRPLRVSLCLSVLLGVPSCPSLPVLLGDPIGVPHRHGLRIQELHMEVRMVQPNQKVVPGPRIHDDYFRAHVEKGRDVPAYATPDLGLHRHHDYAFLLHRNFGFFQF